VKVKIHKGDTVQIISGKRDEVGKRGEVIRVLPLESRVVVQGVNLRKKHQGQVETQGRRNMTPGIIEFEAPIDISNVMLVCPKCDEATRVGVQHEEDGTKKRICKSCGALID
jgi:large subunit ribosomal protein L24